MKKKQPPAPAKAPRASSKAQLPLRPSGTAPAETDEPSAAPRHALKLPEVLAELETAAKALQVRLTYEAIGGELGAGGLCKVKGQWRVIIDKRTTPSERVSVLAQALSRFDFPALQLSPQVHELLLRVAPAAETAAVSPPPSADGAATAAAAAAAP